MKDELILYKPLLDEILEKIQLARYRMLKNVSNETMQLYWNIGKAVSSQVKNEKWGLSIVEKLSNDLQMEFPGIRGFSARNIWRMKTFYEYYEDKSILTPLVAENKQPMGVATFNQYKNLPEIYAKYLPSEEEIIKRLTSVGEDE